MYIIVYYLKLYTMYTQTAFVQIYSRFPVADYSQFKFGVKPFSLDLKIQPIAYAREFVYDVYKFIINWMNLE